MTLLIVGCIAGVALMLLTLCVAGLQWIIAWGSCGRFCLERGVYFLLAILLFGVVLYQVVVFWSRLGSVVETPDDYIAIVAIGGTAVFLGTSYLLLGGGSTDGVNDELRKSHSPN